MEIYNSNDYEKIIKFLMDYKLINSQLACEKCNVKSIKVGSYFEFCRVLHPMLKLIFNFINNVNHSTTSKLTGLARQTIGDYYQRFRYLCSIDLNKDQITLGGMGKIIEIDESMFAKIKHNRGKDLKRKQIWVFGLKDRDSGMTYMEVVKARYAATLLQIIYQRCSDSSVIYSDLWKAYTHISRLNKNFKHLTVNHKLHFVSMWRHAKSKIKQAGISFNYQI